MVTHQNLMTVAEFEAFEALPENQDRRFDLVNAEIVEKFPTQLHGLVVGNVCSQVGMYLRRNRIGRVYIKARYRMPDDEHNARIPDLSYVSDLSREVVENGSAPYMPDLAVEVKSPDDTYDQMREKADYYLKNGSKLVWLIYPEKRLVEVRSAKTGTDILTIDDTLDGGDVLPGFKLPVKAIFSDVAG
jgi:Uma2 family endonuclease